MILPCHDPRYSFKVRNNSEDDALVIREIWCENVYECNEDEFNDTGICIDLGANIGTFSIWAEAHGAKRVLAVEPEPNNLKLLKYNLLQNKSENIEIVKVGISDHTGKAIISSEHGRSTIMDDKPGKTITIRPLEWLWEEYELEYIDVLKVDIEGSEVETILGAPKEILILCRYITLEVDKRSGDSLGDIVSKLSETHQVKVVGSHDTGGMIYARRY